MYSNSNLNSLTKFTSSSRSTEFKYISPQSISQMIAKTVPIGTRLVIQWNWASCCEFHGKSMETWTTTRLEFLHGGKTIVQQILASEEINKSKRLGLVESQFFLFFVLLGFTPCKTEQPLRGMELQEKEAQEDYNIQEICLERTYI